MTNKKKKRAKGIRLFDTFWIISHRFLRLLFPNKPHIFIACLPKSGSTYIASLLDSHAKLKRVRLTDSFDSYAQELSEIRLMRYICTNYLSQHHVCNSVWTQSMISRYNLTTIVLVRDFFDIVISIRDHVRQDTFPFDFPQRHQKYNDSQLEELIATLIGPWLIRFYAGWKQDKNALFLNYQDIVTNPCLAIESILDRANIQSDKATIEKAIKQASLKKSRFNKGIKGRGKNMAPKAKAILFAIISQYPELSDDAFIHTMVTNNK